MINSEEIVTSVKQGRQPATWRILQVKPSYFIGQAVLYIVLALVFSIGLYLLSQSDYVIRIGTGDLDANSFQLWRTIDYIVGGLAVLGFAFLAFSNMTESGSAQNQMLVLMPDGFMLRTSKTSQAIAYAATAKITATPQRSGGVTLDIQYAADGKKASAEIDGRFGKPKEIAQEILKTHTQYATAK